MQEKKSLNTVPFVSVNSMMNIILQIGIERVLLELADVIEEDFKNWPNFEKISRLASHSPDGVIELMPTSDGNLYSFKYVNGHPSNTHNGLQTVAAFGLLADVKSGYPIMISEMTLLTALRTAATSALVAKYLAPKNAHSMAIIGNGSQSEFQAMAFHALLNINTLHLYDIDPKATEKCAANLRQYGFNVTTYKSAEDAVQGVQIITTVTADKQYNTILTDNMIGSGIHINAVGGDCPGKTELHRDILLRSNIFVEYPPQTRIEGEIQQLPEDYPVTELWQVMNAQIPGRKNAEDITLFDSVGFATEDFSALRYIYHKLLEAPYYEMLDMIADPDDPRDLFGMLIRKKKQMVA